MRGVVLLFVLGGCDLVFELHAPIMPDAGAALHRRTITVTPPIQNSLDDFPISVYLEGDEDLEKSMRDDAKDVRFQIDNVMLAHELVSFDKMRGMIEVWVNLPALVGPTTTLDMLYGDEVDLPPSSSGVWSQNVQAVWHLSEPSTALDSTVNGVALRPGAQEPGSDVGIVGGARTFAGTGELLCADSQADFDPADASFSVTLWVFVDLAAGAADRPIARGGGSTAVPGYNFELGGNAWTANLSDDNELVQSVTLLTPMTGQWVQLAAVLKRGGTSELRSYANGAEGTVADASNLGFLTTGDRTCLGDTLQPFKGAIDEVRLYRKALSTDAIAAEHANLAKRDQFMTIGDPIID